MRKLVHHIDRRKWRTIEYFRMLDKQNEMTLDKDNVGTNILVFIDGSSSLENL